MQSRQGQVLLMMVMILATAMTVVLSVSFRSSVETQTTKLEEEAQKALAAAEAGLEARLKSIGTVDIATLNLGPGITGSADIQTVTTQNFVTPLLQKDEQYTFYLANYDGVSTFSSYYTGNITNIYFGSGTGYNCATRNAPALELTYISSTNTVIRKIIEPCTGAQALGTTSIGVSTGSFPFANETFVYRSNAEVISGDRKLVIIKSLFNGTKIGLAGSTTINAQGKTIVSTVNTASGVTKKIQLFQSYPQIPSDFFVTTF